MTGCGLEVESSETWHSVRGGLKGVVIGEVLTCEPHVNSDHLSVTTVNIGKNEPLNIVCGASNVRAGQKVPVATLGTTLFFGDKEIVLQKTKIRGVTSEGMICAEDELGLGSGHEGIMVLSPDAQVGLPAADYFGIEEDTIFTIGLTPNRIDAASHIGVARDLVAVFNNAGKKSVSLPGNESLNLPTVEALRINNNKRYIPVTIQNPEACRRYSGVTITGITVGESPAWLKNRLDSVGLRSINNIVDITNFVLMETGQPLHAFDGDKISGNQVVVKKCVEGTPFVTLDGVERKLSANDLMICNANEPMCIAGVFGGLESGVSASTSTVFLESACFDAVHVRKTSKNHGLQTDASFRFERGSDVDITVYALKRAALLIQEIAGGEISSEIVDEYPAILPPREVIFSYHHLDRLVGQKIDRTVVKNILTDLGISVQKEISAGDKAPDTSLVLVIPSFKVDVTREADVVEEILRIYGYNNIQLPGTIKASLSHRIQPDPEQIQQITSDLLVSNGFYEVIHNSLTKSAYYVDNKTYSLSDTVKILNPISRDLDVMRQTLLYGALECISYNLNRKTTDQKIFEFGRVYRLSADPAEPLPGYHEETHLAIAMTGNLFPETWQQPGKPVDLFGMKSTWETILLRIGLSPENFPVKSSEVSFITEGLTGFSGNRFLFHLGWLDSSLLKEFDIRQPVLYLEADWTTLFSLVPEKNISYRSVPRFPEVRRDLALLVDREITFGMMEKLAYKTESKILRNVGLFDVYEGEKVGDGKKSYALSFLLRDDEKTLTDQEIEKVMSRLIKAFTTQLNAQLR